MPFQKGNKLGTKLKGKPKPRVQQWDNIVGWLIGDGGLQFKQGLRELSEGKDIPKPKKEFLQHYKDLLEFHQPKLARNDTTIKVTEFPQPIVSHEVLNNNRHEKVSSDGKEDTSSSGWHIGQ